jgi:hypothetical protein
LKWLLDFADRRANTVASDNTWLDVIVTSSSAIIAVLPLISKLTELTDRLPYLWIALNVGLPLLACAALLFVISSRQQVPATNAIIIEPKSDVFQYRFAQAKRKTAKFLVIPIVAVTMYETCQSLPNLLMGRKVMAGYVCSIQDGAPVQGSIQILDANGDVVSGRTESLDRSGFFYVRLRGWGFRPVAAQLLSTACSKDKILLSSAPIQSGCSHDDFVIKQSVSTKVLFIDCDGKGKK